MDPQASRASAAESSSAAITIRPATAADVDAIHACLEPFVIQGKVLPRAIIELHELIEQYFVAEMESRIVGCVVLEIYSRKLCEIRSLVVAAEAQTRGIGKRLVYACLERAKKEKILEVMAISSSEEFFQSCGFDFTLPGEKKALFFLPGTDSVP